MRRRFEMTNPAQSPSPRQAVTRATETARRQGYVLTIARAPSLGSDTHTATARRLGSADEHPRFLTHANSEAAAATIGLKILLSVLRGDDFWPDPVENGSQGP
jgi:hypothetical protein